MTNPRKNMLLYKLWLEKEELENIFEKLKKKTLFMGDLEIIGLIIEKAFRRGDLNK